MRNFPLHRAGNEGKGDILFLEREFFLFRTGANVNAAQVPRDATPIFFPEKENGRRPSKRKAFPIASEQLEELQCLPIALPARGEAALSIAIRFASASIIRCRFAYLIEVRSNFRLPRHPSMRRAQQCRIRHAVCRHSTVTRASR